MPQDANCPKCKHIFPVTEARQAFTVPCPQCEADLTIEFKKPATPPEAGQAPYELLVKPGALPGHNKPIAQPKRKPDDDEDEPKRKGGSAMIVLLSGGLGLLFVIGGLGLTGWFLFTQIDTTETVSNRSNNNNNNRGNNNNQNRGNNNNNNNNPPPAPKVEPTFNLQPVRGSVPPITPPNLDNNTTNIALPGKVGAVAVGGGGRYIVMHFPQKAQLGILDVSKPEEFGTLFVESENADVKLAAGLSFVVVYTPGGGGIFRLYSLPDLKKLNDTSVGQLKNVKSIAMGSRTNGPLLAVTGRDVLLLDITRNGLKPIEGSFGQPGQHHDMLRASPDGTAFTTFDGFGNNHKVKLLTEVGRKWKVTDMPQVPFPGTDGYFYGNGAAYSRAGQQVASAGSGIGSNTWMIPAVSGNGGNFVKMSAAPGAKSKRSVALTVHANRNADAPVPGSPTMIGPEIDLLMGAGGSIPRGEAPDHHLFYVPEAKILVILSGNKDKLILRKTDVN